jgi:hypothetical protein
VRRVAHAVRAEDEGVQAGQTAKRGDCGSSERAQPGRWTCGPRLLLNSNEVLGNGPRRYRVQVQYSIFVEDTVYSNLSRPYTVHSEQLQ